MSAPTYKIAIIGLGYVGLPLAIALAKHYPVVGFDIHHQRIAELKEGIDRTHEVTPEDLQATSMLFSDRLDDITDSNVFIVTVPTPIDDQHQPDLTAVRSACTMLAPVLRKNAIVVFESTVYPGVTEDICGPLLEQGSSLKAGQDFFLGYSPERINPGDKVHTVSKITKVVSAQSDDVLQVLKTIYGKVNGDKIFCAASIKTAEAAKVIENAQRDINVAFINEITKIMYHLGLSTHDVLKAASTKWNFLPFQPGLVGGHCIGVDPYYLSFCAEQLGLSTNVILAGRETNEAMGAFLATCCHEQLSQRAKNKAQLLVLGLTFKENVPDTRNTKATHVIQALEDRGHTVHVFDPYVQHDDPEVDRVLLKDLPEKAAYDGIICLVAHDVFQPLLGRLTGLVAEDGVIADVKGLWRDDPLRHTMRYWQL